MEREERYIVLKKKDIDGALSTNQINQLKNICRITNNYRDDIGKEVLKCVVVENDWAEHEVVWQMIEKRVDNSTPAAKKPYQDAEVFIKGYESGTKKENEL